MPLFSYEPNARSNVLSRDVSIHSIVLLVVITLSCETSPLFEYSIQVHRSQFSVEINDIEIQSLVPNIHFFAVKL